MTQIINVEKEKDRKIMKSLGIKSRKAFIKQRKKERQLLRKKLEDQNAGHTIKESKN